MKPDTSKWGDAPAYDFIKDAAADSIAWEFLRRSERYQRDYAGLHAGSAISEPPDVLQRWGLCFRCKA